MERLRRRNEKGFTLIELVLVIIVLGILAAIAIPRFITLREDAENAVGEGIGGSMYGAISMLHAQYLLRRTPYNATSVARQVDIRGAIVSLFPIDAGGTTNSAATGRIVATLTNLRTFGWTYTARDVEVAAELERYY